MSKDGNLEKLIEEFLQYLEIEKNCSPLTIRNYRHYLTRFSTWILENSPTQPNMSVKKISLDVMKNYRVFLARFEDEKGLTLSRQTQAYHIIALRSFLRWMIKNDYETLAPEKIDLPKGESRSLKFLNDEQLDRLLNQPDISTVQGLRDKAILETLFSTGLRVSELVSLNRDSINLDQKEFGVIGKGRKARVVFLSERAVEWLGRYLSARDDVYKPLFIRFLKNDLAVPEEKLRLTVRSNQRKGSINHLCQPQLPKLKHFILNLFSFSVEGFMNFF